MTVEITLVQPPFEARLLQSLLDLSAGVFGQSNPAYVTWRIANMPDVSLFGATEAGALIGFKLGYAMTQEKYYSWLGGVRADCRRRGIAAELMRRQHAWLAQRGYRVVETAADQDNHAMARANLRHGFSICGMRAEPTRTQILYLKMLVRRDEGA
jgi:predicted GNAT superfamily acetyltransferase